MRMTMHLVSAEDHDWMAPLFWERTARWSRRRLDSIGVDGAAVDRSLAKITKRLAADAPMPRSAMMELAAGAGIEPSVQVRTHLAVLMVCEGHACIGPEQGGESTLVARGDWLGPTRPRDRHAALAELARRYFAAYAPASQRDFSYWAGLPLRDCRAAIAAIAGEVVEVRCGEATLLAPRGWTARSSRSSVVRLLGAFDTYLMGYTTRRHAVDVTGEQVILPGGGVLRPTILIDGRFAGTWSQKRSGKRLRMILEPFSPLDDELTRALAKEAADIGRFEAIEAILAS